MPNSDKAAEPSMEEILASIRKIISEEPDGADAVPATQAPAEAREKPTLEKATPDKAKPAEVSTSGAIWTSGRRGSDDDLSDILDQPGGEHGAGAAGEPPTSSQAAVRPPPAPSMRPTFGQRQAPPPIDAETAAPAEPPRSSFPPAQSGHGEVSDTPFGLPLPVQPMNAERPRGATPPLPAAPTPDRSVAPSLRRAAAPASPPPFGASGADAPIVPPPPSPPPTLRRSEARPVESDQKPSLGFTLADRLRAFGHDGDQDKPGADAASESDNAPDAPPAKASAPPSEFDDVLDDPDPFGLPDTQPKARDARPETGELEADSELDGWSEDETASDAPEPDADEVAASPFSAAPEPFVARPERPQRRSLFSAPLPEADPPAPPEPRQSNADADVSAREPAMRRGLFGMLGGFKEEPTDESDSEPTVNEPVSKSVAAAQPENDGDDEPFGARALEFLAEPPQEEELQLEPLVSDASVAADEADEEPAVDEAPVLPGAEAAPATGDVSTPPAMSPPPVAPAATMASSAVEQAAPSSIPAAASAPAVEDTPSETTQPTAHTVGSRTLEDAVSELLRPMLRDWLDANMPRIVEKAVKGELANFEIGKSKATGPNAGED